MVKVDKRERVFGFYLTEGLFMGGPIWTETLCISCMRDEGRSFGVGFQKLASNHSKLLRSKAVGGERWRQRVEETPRAGRDQRDERH